MATTKKATLYYSYAEKQLEQVLHPYWKYFTTKQKTYLG